MEEGCISFCRETNPCHFPQCSIVLLHNVFFLIFLELFEQMTLQNCFQGHCTNLSGEILDCKKRFLGFYD